MAEGGEASEELKVCSYEEKEEEVEPKLRYEPLQNDLAKILEKDGASCIAVHTKFMALGTFNGFVYILDHHGNNIRNKELALHTKTVNQISIDINGDFIATCSNDERIVIQGLYSSENNLILSFNQPVLSIAIDPNFAKPGSKKRFITGNNKVLLYEKGLFGQYKNTVLHQSESIVQNIKWKGQFLAWATDKHLRIYDIVAFKIIALIKRDQDSILWDKPCRCNLFWKDNLTLLVGWGDYVKLCVIRQRIELGTVSNQSLPNHIVEIISIFTINYQICGIAPFNEDDENNIVVLTVPKNNKGTGFADKPKLQVLEPHRESCSEVSIDILMPIQLYTEYRCNDYFLDGLPEEKRYIIGSPKDIVIAKPRDESDHIEWLLKQEKFEEALKVVTESKTVGRFTVLDVGRRCLNHLFKQQLYADAAALCPTILGNNKEAWEEEVHKFKVINQCRAIAPYLPTDEKNHLKASVYELVLDEFITYDSAGFLKLIKTWPYTLYEIKNIINAVHYKLESDPHNNNLLRSLSELYIYEKKYDKALAIYLTIGEDRVFEVIRDFNMFSAILDKLEQLLKLNCEKATQLLLDNMDKIPIDVVVSKLKDQSLFLYKYLDKLFVKNKEFGEKHHGLLVKLYAEHDQDRLLTFLKSSNNYPLEEALEICQQRKFIEEEIFLLGRMGNTKEALKQITQELKDIKKAVEFCKDHDDKELWEDLIKYSLDKPQFIKYLLENIGTHVDPIMLIKEIENDLQIEGLQDSLVKILQDYHLQVSLREGCNKILVSDCYSLLEKLNLQQKRGIRIDEDQICQACHHRLLITHTQYAEDILIFYCKHAFHKGCLSSDGMKICSICNAQKQFNK
ncbi:vacuolar protein sorting-associated protein 41 homolog isoform X2 [Centruroides sculpturatus]|nr:vacuolar protein sorting-associated protein 41 homolog isoform X2 [Centruroides sculpturatus]